MSQYSLIKSIHFILECTLQETKSFAPTNGGFQVLNLLFHIFKSELLVSGVQRCNGERGSKPTVDG